MKLCKDCKHARRNIGDWIASPFRPWRYAKCMASACIERDALSPLDGRNHQKVTIWYCFMERDPTGKCGPDGTLWEPRE